MKIISDAVRAILFAEYEATVAYQLNKNCITVTMTFEEYLTLWSSTRIDTIARKLSEGQASLQRYLRDRFNRPVCSWRSRSDLQRGGTMSLEHARIVRAEDSRRMFQFQVGDNHSPESKESIGLAKRGKKQTEEQIAARTASRLATMAAKRAAKNAGLVV